MPDENETKKRVDIPQNLYENLFDMLLAISQDNSMNDKYRAVSRQVIRLFAGCRQTARGQACGQPASREADSSRTGGQPVGGQANGQTVQR